MFDGASLVRARRRRREATSFARSAAAWSLCVALRAYARHRLSRLPLIGVLNPAAVVRPQRDVGQPLREAALEDFYAHQAYVVAREP